MINLSSSSTKIGFLGPLALSTASVECTALSKAPKLLSFPLCLS